jgi:hypothetical protein
MFVLVAMLVAPVGCYDGERLVKRARNAAIRTRSEEVSLGYFRTTLPREANGGTPMEVELELFVTTKRYRVQQIERVIEAESARLRQKLLVAIRETTAEEIADPRLVGLRQRLLAVTKEIFVKPPIDSMGIRQIRFIPL